MPAFQQNAENLSQQLKSVIDKSQGKVLNVYLHMGTHVFKNNNNKVKVLVQNFVIH